MRGRDKISSCALSGCKSLLLARFYLWRIPPKIFEVVKFTDVGPHYMDDHVKIIEHHPRCIDRPVRPAWREVMFLLEMFLDLVNDCPQVGFARTGADDEVIGDAGDFSEVENYDVFCVFIVCHIPAEVGLVS